MFMKIEFDECAICGAETLDGECDCLVDAEPVERRPSDESKVKHRKPKWQSERITERD